MNFRTCSLVALLTVSLLASCQGTDDKAGDSKEEKKAVKKGRIWDKVNIVQIPLTAEEYPLLGKVKTMTYRDYRINEKTGEKELAAHGQNTYDAFGHLVNQNEYNAQDEPKWKCTYSYGADNRRKEWHFIFYERNDESTTTFRYDEQGNIVEEIETAKTPEESTRTTYKYDNDGNLLEEIMYDANGKISNITQSQYDAKGNQIEQVYKTAEGKIRYKRTVAYDENGLKISGEDYQGDTLTGKSIYKYLSYGKPLEMAFSDTSGNINYKVAYKYDKMGNTIERETTTYKDGKPETKKGTSTYEYDKVGNIIKETDYQEKEGKMTATSYSEAEYTYHE